MRNPAMLVGIAALAAVVGSAVLIPTAHAQGSAPSSAVCGNKENPPKDMVTQGGCVAIDRRKGNCQACHLINGIAAGNIAPPLVSMKQRFPDKAKLRAQIHDARIANPNTVMPPFGAHHILSKDEVDKVVEWVLSL